MKKLFTLLMAACTAASAWALAPQLLFGNTPVVAGQTYETGYTIEELDLGVMVIKNYTQDSDLFLEGILGEPITVEVKASQPVAVCSVTGQCQSGDNVVKKGAFGEADLISETEDTGIIALRIENMEQDVTGTADPATLLSNITVNVKAYYDDYPQDAVETTVILTNKPASEVGGVADVTLDTKDSVSLGASNTLNYNVAAPTKLAIYNASGALVMSRLVKANGSISLDSLHPGVYIYHVGNLAGKILVHK